MAELAAAAGGAVLLVLVIRKWLCLVTVIGDSMAPALRDGDRLLVIRARRRIRVGSVVVFAPPPGYTDVPWLVKRVAGLEDDPRRGPFTVRGDASVSLDSRQFGAVQRDAIVGVAVHRFVK